MKQSDYLDTEQISPFSNGSEAMDWVCNNCGTCKRAHKPKDPNNPPNFSATVKLVNLGMECKMKLSVDFGFVTGTMAKEMAVLIGYTEENGFPDSCMFHSDDDRDGWHPVYKPKQPPDNQMCLPFALNEICPETVKELICQ